MMKKNTSLVKATLLVSILAIAGKCLGFIRQAVIAAFFGATAETDAFFFAQELPHMIFPSIGSSFAMGFTTLYVQRTEQQGIEEADRFASRTLNAMCLLGVVLSLLGVVIAPGLVGLFAPGFSQAQSALAIRLSRLTMGAFLLTVLNYLLGAILNSRKRFYGSQIASLVHNTTIIGITLLLGRSQSMSTLTLTEILGIAAQAAVLAFCCCKCFRYTAGQNPIHADSGTLLKMSLPILLGNSVVQLNSIVDKALASTLSDGALSALSYAHSLSSMVITVFVTTLSTVLYPTLTAEAAKGNIRQYGETLFQSVKGLSFLLVPVCCITMMSAPDIVTFVYGRGSFNQTAVGMTAIVLACYAPRFVFVGIREVMTRGYFSVQDTKTPARNSAIGVGCNIVCSLILVRWLGIAGIALATSLSALVTSGLLLWHARRKLPTFPVGRYLRKLRLQVGAGAVSCLALAGCGPLLRLPYAILRFVVSTLIGFSVYLLVMYVVDRQELRGAMQQIPWKKLKKKKRFRTEE